MGGAALCGLLGVSALDNGSLPLMIALALMFLLTASAQWGRGGRDLVRMVPPALSFPGTIITLGAIGLVIPLTSRAAAICLTILLVALFPANVRAARENLTILGRPAPRLMLRGATHCCSSQPWFSLPQTSFFCAVVSVEAEPLPTEMMHQPGG